MPPKKKPSRSEAEIRDFLSRETRNLAEAKMFEEEAKEKRIGNLLEQIRYDEMKLEHEFQFAANSVNRTYDFTESVTSTTTERAIQTLSRWARMDKRPITIRFTSPGGGVISGFALYDYIKSIGAQGIPTTILAMGQAASMAGILLQAGDRRVMAPQSWLLIHEISAGTAGSLGQIKDDLKFYERLNDQGVDILAERAKIGRDEIKKLMDRKDCWITAKEALEYGFVDEVAFA